MYCIGSVWLGFRGERVTKSYIKAILSMNPSFIVVVILFFSFGFWQCVSTFRCRWRLKWKGKMTTYLCSLYFKMMGVRTTNRNMKWDNQVNKKRWVIWWLIIWTLLLKLDDVCNESLKIKTNFSLILYPFFFLYKE